MKRFIIVLFSVILFCMSFTSCSQSVSVNKTQTSPTTAGSTLTPTNSALPPASSAVSTTSPSKTPELLSPSPTSAQYPDRSDLKFADLTDLVFIFSSGAGSWSSEIKISPDGTFSGYYSDSDMGDDGPDYPNGTLYECSFSGKFTSLKKIGSYEYSMQCESLTQEGTPDKIEIKEDGIRYITSTPYGLDNANEIILYLPGKKISELPQEFLDWASGSTGNDYKNSGVLPFYGLYNVAGQQGFASHSAQS